MQDGEPLQRNRHGRRALAAAAAHPQGRSANQAQRPVASHPISDSGSVESLCQGPHNAPGDLLVLPDKALDRRGRLHHPASGRRRIYCNPSREEEKASWLCCCCTLLATSLLRVQLMKFTQAAESSGHHPEWLFLVHPGAARVEIRTCILI